MAPTDVVVIRPKPVVGGEALRPDKVQVFLNWVLDLPGRARTA